MARQAFFIIGIGWLVVILGLVYWWFNGGFIQYRDTFPTSTSTPMTDSRSLSLSSAAFEAGASIPAAYTCDLQASDQQLSPPLRITGEPSRTKTLAIIMEDRDVPKNLKADGTFLHWVVFNIPAGTVEIAEGESVGVSGLNGVGAQGYMGPCPPPQYEPREHRYYFNLYALDTTLGIPAGATKDEVVQAMQGHIIDEAELMGRYQRREK